MVDFSVCLLRVALTARYGRDNRPRLCSHTQHQGGKRDNDDKSDDITETVRRKTYLLQQSELPGGVGGQGRVTSLVKLVKMVGVEMWVTDRRTCVKKDNVGSLL